MKSKYLLLVLVLSFCFCFAGCGLEMAKDDGPLEISEESEPEEVNDAVESNEETEEVIEESQEENEDVIIEVVEGSSHSAEFEEAFESAEACGGNFSQKGDDNVSEFDTWQEGYTALIKELTDVHDFALIYVNDDEIPELYYEAPVNGGSKNICIVTFNNGYVNIFAGNIEEFDYLEKENAAHVIFYNDGTNPDFEEMVVAIKNNQWAQIGYGVKTALDLWAEDGFDENGNPIISSWSWNYEEVDGQEAYDETLINYFDDSQAASVQNTVDQEDILLEIDEME